MEFESFLGIYGFGNHPLISDVKAQTVIIGIQFAHDSLNYIQADKLVEKTFLTFTNNLSYTNPSTLDILI